jgi:hypothetical protein
MFNGKTFEVGTYHQGDQGDQGGQGDQGDPGLGC